MNKTISSSRAKLKAAIQEEETKMWKEHFKNLQSMKYLEQLNTEKL